VTGRTTFRTCAAVLGCALVGLVLAGPAAATSRSFTIVNLSSHALELETVKGLSYHFGFEGRPRDGERLMPGGVHDWELQDGWTVGTLWTGVEVGYRVVGEGAAFRAQLWLDGLYVNSWCGMDYGSCTAGRSRVEVRDPPGTVVDVPPADQAQRLRELCTNTSLAQCSFTPVARAARYLPTLVASRVVGNCDREDALETSVAADHTVQATNSIGASADPGAATSFIFAKAKDAFERAYGPWLLERRYSSTMAIRVAPRHLGWIAATLPVLRDTGAFSLGLGETTFTLRGPYFDTPDPSRVGRLFAQDRPMTAEEEAACTQASSTLLTRSPSAVMLHRSGTAGDDLMEGKAESNTLRGLRGDDRLRGGHGHDALHGGRGHDVLHGGPGRDALHGGPGRDALHGGPGRDALHGGRGADRLTDRSGATRVWTGTATGAGTDVVDVRDGRGDDVVRCGSSRSRVIGDPGDRVTGRCGTVRLLPRQDR
jgi:hypothetical protein